MNQKCVMKLEHVELRLDEADLKLLEGGHSIIRAVGGGFRICKDAPKVDAKAAVGEQLKYCDKAYYRGFVLVKQEPPAAFPCRIWTKVIQEDSESVDFPSHLEGSLVELMRAIDHEWELAGERRKQNAKGR